MFQVLLSDQCLHELNQLETAQKMQVLERLSNLTQEELTGESDEMGSFNRENKTFYRLRIGEFRIYFEILPEKKIQAHYFLHQHSLKDFIFRFKLPASEETFVEQKQSFWKYLESLTK